MRYALRFIVFFFLGFLSFSEFQKDPAKDVQKVKGLIDKILIEQIDGKGDSLREVIVSESELNSYIAYLIVEDGEELLKEFRLKLLQKNRIEARMFVDLRGHKLPSLLRPEMMFYMGGTLEVEDGKVRLDLKELFLEGQRIQPMVIDLVIFISSRIQKTEPWGIGDWFDIPYGIKNIKVNNGNAIFYY
jgi:hypothetical protein